ncbi:SDR family NAD(P)-dependent oxidoreductase [Nocardiopsis sp. JB363]|uniref:SDR family NAD(P)-dependent oxidoreductase n=1 Tax=Nocardiopsis sp. JB363 TaxID=1434837 RepID=UPI00097BA3BE|nr:SDR family NAD(P)-dependent oxidoreductase [Nocardiopsis sp. JB363]SIO89717.1 probable oxidoreductase/Short-chain dehydrogenase [Nocardiopsis sp. JB363]
MVTARRPRTLVVSGGTDGMGRALALARAALGDHVVAIGSDPGKGTRLIEQAPPGRVEFLRADLSTVAGTREAITRITTDHEHVDALVLFANRQSPTRTMTPEGLERTFALYYLSRYLLCHGLTPALARAPAPVIVNVAGVGMTKGGIHWNDPHLERGYGMVTAQLQAGRANDLLGVDHARRHGERVPQMLYHPGFTRSGDLTPLAPPLRLVLKAMALLAARPVEKAIAPIHGFVDSPPSRPLTAIDRSRRLPLDLPTLDPGDATRLSELTEALLVGLAPGTPP